MLSLVAIPSRHSPLFNELGSVTACVRTAGPPSATWGAPPTGALPGAASTWTACPSGSTTRRTSRQSCRLPHRRRHRLHQTSGFRTGAAPIKQATRTTTRSATAGTCRTVTKTQSTVLPSAPQTRCRRAAQCLPGGSSVTMQSGAMTIHPVRLAGCPAVQWSTPITTSRARAGGTPSTATPSGGCPTATSSPDFRARSRQSANRCQTGRHARP